MNRLGNRTNRKTDTQIVNEARALQGMYLVHASKKIHTSHLRLKALAKEHGLYFRYLTDDRMSDCDVLMHIKKHQHTDSAQMLHAKIGVSWERIKKIAALNGIELKNKRKTPNLNPVRQDDKGYWLKICSGCGEEKGVEFFFADATAKTGLCSQCKQCTKLRQSGYSVKKEAIV